MKKLLALAGIALIAAACTNNDEPVQECGQINLTLENSTAPEIEVSTRTVTDLTETDAKDYNIQVLQNGNVKLESTNFLTFKNTTFIFPIRLDNLLMTEWDKYVTSEQALLLKSEPMK